LVGRAGRERKHDYASETELRPGDVLRLDGRDWLVDTIEDGDPARALAKPARYRLRLHHEDGREELGAFRRYRPDAPRLGHSFTTTEDGQPVVWEVVDQRLEHDEQGEPFLDLVAERDYGEFEDDLPNHELEHAQAAREAGPPTVAVDTIRRAQEAGLNIELVALDPGEFPDWTAAARYTDTLILEEIEDDLLEMCGVGRDDPRDTWLATVKERLATDLERFRADIEGGHQEIEEWDYLDGRVFASVGTIEDESDPDKGHGWMCRLVDVSALSAAGFHRVRKLELDAA
jgi:hypothetical protein